MMIMLLEKVPPALQGEITQWLIEVKTGVYIGDVSARVRDQLWAHCLQRRNTGGVFQAWTANNEQGFHMRLEGINNRRVIEWEGVELIEEMTDEMNEVQKRRTKHR